MEQHQHAALCVCYKQSKNQKIRKIKKIKKSKNQRNKKYFDFQIIWLFWIRVSKSGNGIQTHGHTDRHTNTELFFIRLRCCTCILPQWRFVFYWQILLEVYNYVDTNISISCLGWNEKGNRSIVNWPNILLSFSVSFWPSKK